MSIGAVSDSVQAQRERVWQDGAKSMHPNAVFETHLEAIERAIRFVCRDARLSGADAEDFASSVRLALLANDGAILRKYEGRSSFGSYITVVVRRLLVDQQRAEGRWYASAEARRGGEAALLLDQLLHRDHRTFDEAAAIVMDRHPGATAAELRAIAAALPHRAPRPRLVELNEDEDEQRFASGSSAEERVVESDLARRSESISRVVSAAFEAMTPQDRVILRLRFGKEASIADIARALGLEQRPLYRHVETLLAELRRAIQQAGFDASMLTDLIAGGGDALEFGLRRNSEGTS
jgi:RNA polymerase sigma factor (sigma-70 family)